MTTRNATVASAVGLHARPAALFTRKAAEAGISVLIGRPGGQHVNAASMLAVMSLGVKHGEEVELSAEGAAADEVLDGLKEFLETDLDAKE